MKKWNPWWDSGSVPDALKKVRRRIDPLILKALSIREVIILAGIRRSGKTTLMYQLIDTLLDTTEPEQILYLNLDDPLLGKQTIEELYETYRQSFNPNKKAFIFFDEVRNVPEWERSLKKYYDLADDVKFIVSGSSSSLLIGEYATLLTGRNLTFRIYPLSFGEFINFREIKKEKNVLIHSLRKYLEIGGFPEVCLAQEALRTKLLGQYFNDILYKDVIFRHNIDAKKLTDIAVYLLTNVAKPFTLRSIRSFTGLATDSIQDYVSYLEDAFLVTVLDHFSYSLKEVKHTQRPKKIYCTDNGMCNAVGFRFSDDCGRLAENVVCMKLVRECHDVYYWRGKGEVDFVVREGKEVTAINVTYSDRIPAREAQALLEFRKAFRSRVKDMIMLTKDTEKTEDGIRFIPLWRWLLQDSEKENKIMKR